MAAVSDWAFRGARGGFDRRDVNTFDRHLLREWLSILGMVLFAMCGLLLAQVMLDDFKNLRDDGARGWELWSPIFGTMPSFFATVLPVALLLSLLFALGKLHRANELTAMRAAGVGFMRMTRPLWVIGVLCCGLTWWLNASVVPKSVEYAKAKKEEVKFRHAQKTLTPDLIGAEYAVAFANPRAGRIWFFDRFSKFTERGYGVTVSTLDAQHRETSRLVATEAWRDTERGGWNFSAGRLLTFNEERGELVASEPFAFKHVVEYPEDPELMLLIGKRPIDLSAYELRKLIDYFDVENKASGVPYAVSYYSLIAETLAPLIVIAIAIPFAVSGVRVNPAVGVSKSIVLFVLYFALKVVARSIAEKGYIEPEFAAWLPNAGMIALAGCFFVRLR